MCLVKLTQKGYKLCEKIPPGNATGGGENVLGDLFRRLSNESGLVGRARLGGIFEWGSIEFPIESRTRTCGTGFTDRRFTTPRGPVCNPGGRCFF